MISPIIFAVFPTLLDGPVIRQFMAVFSNLPSVRVGVNSILLVLDVEILLVDVLKNSLTHLRRVGEDLGRFRFEIWPAIFGSHFVKLFYKACDLLDLPI